MFAGTLQFPARKLGRKKAVLKLTFAGNLQLKAITLTKGFRVRHSKS